MDMIIKEYTGYLDKKTKEAKKQDAPVEAKKQEASAKKQSAKTSNKKSVKK